MICNVNLIFTFQILYVGTVIFGPATALEIGEFDTTLRSVQEYNFI